MIRSSSTQARQELPQPLTSRNLTLLSPPDAPTIRLRLTPKAGTKQVLSDLHFFSSDGQVSSDQPQLLDAPSAGSFDLVLRRSKLGPKDATHLPGVLFSGHPFGT